jgi:hypothetical protein
MEVIDKLEKRYHIRYPNGKERFGIRYSGERVDGKSMFRVIYFSEKAMSGQWITEPVELYQCVSFIKENCEKRKIKNDL